MEAPMQPNQAPRPNVKISCLSPFETMASIKLAGEVPMSKYVSLQLMAGYFFHYSFDREKLDPAKQSFNIALEGRYYIPNNTLYGLYGAARIGYSSINYLSGVQKSSLVTSDTISPPNLSFNFDSPWKYHRDELSGYLFVGLQTKIVKVLALDIDLGIANTYTIDRRLSPVDSYKGVMLPNAKTTRMNASAVYGLGLGYFF
jgi:hypothetical protein